jgi:rhodanese-related sulfurtransferase
MTATEGSDDYVLATVDEIQRIINNEEYIIVDARNPTSESDQKNFDAAPLPNPEANIRPKAINLMWTRDSKSIELPPPSTSKDTYIITHCGGGARGELAKNYLIEQGYTNVYNGGGPRVKELWEVYGQK